MRLLPLLTITALGCSDGAGPPDTNLDEVRQSSNLLQQSAERRVDPLHRIRQAADSSDIVVVGTLKSVTEINPSADLLSMEFVSGAKRYPVTVAGRFVNGSLVLNSEAPPLKVGSKYVVFLAGANASGPVRTAGTDLVTEWSFADDAWSGLEVDGAEAKLPTRSKISLAEVTRIASESVEVQE